MRSPVPSRSTARGSLLSLGAAIVIGCGPELAATGSTASMQATSGEESGGDMSEEDRMAWLVISIILGVTSVGFTVAGITDEGMWAYLQEHQQDVRVALANGEGPFPSDLTQSLGLPAYEMPRVAGMLRAGRPTLEPHLRTAPLAEEDARAFSSELLALLEADPVTGPRIEALRERALVLARR